MIVKMQRPLFSTDPYHQPMLIYNRDRSYRADVPMTPEYEAMFREHGLEEYGRAKLFAEVSIHKGAMKINAISDEDLGW